MNFGTKEEILEAPNGDTLSEFLSLKSCLKKHKLFNIKPKFEKREKHLIYSPAAEEFGTERESRIKEWKKEFQPFILPSHIRNHHRSSTVKPHFWNSGIKKEIKYHRFRRPERFGLVEISLQNGLGGRYRMVSRQKGERDYALRCILKFGQGQPCCIPCARRIISDEVLNNWDIYKWEVKQTYSYNIDFFRTYNPSDTDTAMQEYAMFLYQAANEYQAFDAKRVDLRAACKLRKLNFCVIEIINADNFKVMSTKPEFERTMIFFVQNNRDVGEDVKRIEDKDAKKYRNYVFTWLQPIRTESEYLIVRSCKMVITYSNTDIGYLHLFEEDPSYSIEKFRQSNNLKRARHRYVTYYPMVYILFYYQKDSMICYNVLMRGCRCWYPRDIDERILRYDQNQVSRYHSFEEEFTQTSKISTGHVWLSPDFEKKAWNHVKDYMAHLNSYDEEPPQARSVSVTILRKLYVQKKVMMALKEARNIEKLRVKKTEPEKPRKKKLRIRNVFR